MSSKLVFDHLTDEQTKNVLSALGADSKENVGKIDESITRIFVGAGTCGLGAGAGHILEVLKEYKEKHDQNIDIVEVGCIGLCFAEPVVDIALPGKNRVSFGNVDAGEVLSLLEKAKNGEASEDHALYQFDDGKESWNNVCSYKEHPYIRKQTRWVLESCGVLNPTSIEEYISNGGYAAFVDTVKSKKPADICKEIEESGLRGRGGGGFPTAFKWKIALDQKQDQKYFICNADEGDPGAFMDRAIMEGDPHRLIEGLAIASLAIGASKAYIYSRAEYPLAIENLNIAIDAAKKVGFLGKDILGTGFSLDIVVKKGAGAFVCGEETALIHSVEGKRGMPRPRPPFPAVSGLFGKPTIINNVETLANVPKIMKEGAAWFAGVGTESSKGTKVFALSGKVKNTGLIEVEMGTSIREIVFDIGGGTYEGKEYKAVQIGGPSGGCIPIQNVDIEVDYESLKTVGAMMGSGGLVVMDNDNCMVDVAKFFMDFIQRESCGKCIPCREGTKKMLQILEDITRGHHEESGNDALDRFKGVLQLEKLAEVVRETSLCGLGQTAPSPVLSTLKWFRHEYEEHIFERKCKSGTCQSLVTYSVIDELCKGCTLCKRKCPVDAIKGSPKEVHVIDQDKCVKCGECVSSCRFNAIETV